MTSHTCRGGGEGKHLAGDLVGREVVFFEEVKLPFLGLLKAVDSVIDRPVVLSHVKSALG